MTEQLSIPTAALSIFDSSRFELAMRQADVLAKSDLVPKAFQGKPENCLIALELADRMSASAFMVMQNVDIIHGKPGFSAKFLVGCFNACGRFEPISYEDDDQDGGRCRAVSVAKSSRNRVVGPWVSMNMAKAEGWVDKNGSKWKTMPELMLRYRAASFMIRTTAPELSLGLPTTEEIYDTGGEMGQETRDTRDITPRSKFAREAAEKTVETPTVEVLPPTSVQDKLKERLASSGITVKEALFALNFIGIGDGKTPFSKMDDETLAKILKSWDVVADEVAAHRSTEGGAK